MAYKPPIAAALSGASLGQLAYWRRSDESRDAILVPEISARRPILYSFRDVVALRTCVFLRGDVSLQRIRRAFATLEDLGEQGHLSQYTLVAHGNKSIVLVREDEVIDLVERPGTPILANMREVVRPFKPPAFSVKVPSLFRPRKSLRVVPAVRGGNPVIAGTRIRFELVAGLVKDGVPVDEVGDYFPGVSATAAADAVDFAEYVERFAYPRPLSA